MGPVEAVLAGIYGLPMVGAGLNAALMLRPPRRGERVEFCALIPARDEAGQIGPLAAELVRQGVRVYVFDDESTDGTGEEAAAAGAVVIRPGEPLPEGWKGKCRACRALAQAASEAFSGEWAVFLDADTQPGSEFAEGMGRLIAAQGRRFPVITGFPRYLPGRGIEPAYLMWVTWMLLASNPFWLVGRTGQAHNFFTNGQVTAWRLDQYWESDPHLAMKGRILEDVAIGRLLAKQGVRVLTADLSRILSVRMYADVGAAVQGMTKNSAEIAGGGSWLLVLGLLGVAWAWLLWPPSLALLVLSALLSGVVSRHPWWTALLAPLSLSAAAATIVRSLSWRRRGRIEWKGRVYRD
jgi:hypothetical protein